MPALLILALDAVYLAVALGKPGAISAARIATTRPGPAGHP